MACRVTSTSGKSTAGGGGWVEVVELSEVVGSDVGADGSVVDEAAVVAVVDVAVVVVVDNVVLVVDCDVVDAVVLVVELAEVRVESSASTIACPATVTRSADSASAASATVVAAAWSATTVTAAESATGSPSKREQPATAMAQTAISIAAPALVVILCVRITRRLPRRLNHG